MWTFTGLDCPEVCLPEPTGLAVIICVPRRRDSLPRDFYVDLEWNRASYQPAEWSLEPG